MGTGFIPGPDLSFIRDIGKSIAQIIDPNKERRQQIEEFFLANPEIGGQFALAQREAERQFQAAPPPDVGVAGVEGVVPNVLEQFGFDLDKTQQLLSAFPETSEERLAQAREKAGLPALQVEAEVSTLREGIATSGYRQKLTAALDERGIPDLQAAQAAAEAVFGTKLTKFQGDFLDKWITRLGELQESNPFEFRRALAAMNSPEFLRDLQFREGLALRGEELDVQQALAGIEAAQGTADRDIKLFGLTLDAQKNLNTQLDRLKEALEEGTEEEKALGIDRVNEAAALVRAVSPAGATFAIDPGKRGFFTGRLKGIRFTRLAPGSLSIPLSVQYERLLSVFESAGTGTSFETLQQQLMQSEDGRAFLGELTPQERSQFFTHAQQQFGALRIAEEAGEVGEKVELSDEELDTEITQLEAEFKAATPETHSIKERLELRSDLNKLKSQKRRRRPSITGGIM